MSPAEAVQMLGKVGFPRVSGDEPPKRRGDKPADAFSPRERG